MRPPRVKTARKFHVAFVSATCSEATAAVASLTSRPCGAQTVEMASEEWRAIPGYEGLYEASSLGRIRSHHRGGKIKEAVQTRDGYLLTFLHLDGTRHGYNVHRLVCLAFHGLPPEDGMEAAHLDGSRLNNVPDNLVWATRLQNIRHKIEHGTTRPGILSPVSVLTEQQVKEAWLSPERAKVVAARMGVTHWAIDDVRSGKNWSHLTRGLANQPERPVGSYSLPTDPPSGFAEAAAEKPHWRVLAQRFGMSKPTVYRYLAKLRGTHHR
jgi:hypothetical protein